MIEKERDGYKVRAELVIEAPIEEVWESFMDPKKSAEFFFGIAFESDLLVGHPITWSGEWEGKSFVDRGRILEIRKPRLFRYDYFSALSGLPDLPENHFEVAYSFDPVPGGVMTAITQSKIATREQAEHSAGNWEKMLAAVAGKLTAL